MNDFTKDELILLACWSVNRLNQVGIDQAKDEGTISLSHKIQDMVINKIIRPSHEEFADRECLIKG